MNPIIALVIAFAMISSADRADARPPEVERTITGARVVGEAPYRVLSFTLFDAALWSQDGVFSWDRPFALTLTYRRAFRSSALVSRSVVEMSRRGAAQAGLNEALSACFADVSPGDRITGVSTGPNSATFHYNGRQRCQIEWPGFRSTFFGIWLDASGSRRAFSEQLRGSGSPLP